MAESKGGAELDAVCCCSGVSPESDSDSVPETAAALALLFELDTTYRKRNKHKPVVGTKGVGAGRALENCTLGFTGDWMDNLRDTSWGVGGAAAGCAIPILMGRSL
jgi:hypothetical protein